MDKNNQKRDHKQIEREEASDQVNMKSPDIMLSKQSKDIRINLKPTSSYSKKENINQPDGSNTNKSHKKKQYSKRFESPDADDEQEGDGEEEQKQIGNKQIQQQVSNMEYTDANIISNSNNMDVSFDNRQAQVESHQQLSLQDGEQHESGSSNEGDERDSEEQEPDHELAEEEEGSDIFDTDSSDDDEVGAGHSEGETDLKLGKLESDVVVSEHKQTVDPDKEEIKEEMGGTLVYDSYCRLKGNTKIEAYYAAAPSTKVQTDILFSKQESKDVAKDIFADKARERDFGCDQDKHFYRNLPKFQTQREYSNLQTNLLIPDIQNVLIFDSRFENGNLRKAAKVSNIEYNLWLENDLNTKGHTQWYYFKVVHRDITLAADKKAHRVKFNILNLAKTSSLYQVGMKPCVWSRRRHDADGTGWFRGGEDISYRQNEIPRYENEVVPPRHVKGFLNNNNAFLLNNNGAGEGVDFYYTFSFTYEFEAHVDDEVWFAHAIPYTYTHMQEQLAEMRANEKYSSIMKMNILCYTLGKSPVPLVTITDNVSTYLDYYEEMRLMHQVPNVVKKQFRQKFQKAKKLARQGEDSKGRVKRLLEAAFEEEIKCFFEYNEDHFLTTSPQFAGFGNRLNQYLKDHGPKKAIVITSRVHPGEPQASHMLDGLLEYLLSKEADQLRKNFVIRIVPMLNPDGVVYGNYRCSLLGCDLNRKWEKPNRLLHPTIFHSKQLIRHMHSERKVVLYCDLHGHSRKQNAFFYGCAFKNYEQEGRIKNAQLRIIPLLCCQRNNLFSLKDSRFNVEKCKESTARVVVFKEMNIMNSFTLECSFFGKDCNTHTESTQNMNGAFATAVPKKRKLLHMSTGDYNSLGDTLMQVMHNYLPSEQSKLQFISGKILDVFYDEFIKFIPPYILKREEEKRKKLEKGGGGGTTLNASTNANAMTAAQKRQRMSCAPGTSFSNASNMRNEITPVTNVLSKRVEQTNKKQADIKPVKAVNSSRQRNNMSAKAGVRLADKSSKNQVSINDYDRKADRTAAAKTKLANVGINGEESSDQKMVQGMSGKEETDTDHFGTLMNIPHHENDIMEFEYFMNGIQSNLKEKEEQKKKKLERMLGGLTKNGEAIMAEIQDLQTNQLDMLVSDSSSGGTSEEETYKERQKRKARQQQKSKQLEKLMKKAAEKAKKLEADKLLKQAENPMKSPRDSKSPITRKPRRKKKKQQAQTEDKDKDKDQHAEPGDSKAPLHQITVGMGVLSSQLKPGEDQMVSVKNKKQPNFQKVAMANVNFGAYGANRANFQSINSRGTGQLVDENYPPQHGQNPFQNEAIQNASHSNAMANSRRTSLLNPQNDFTEQPHYNHGFNFVNKVTHVRTKSKQGPRNVLLNEAEQASAQRKLHSRNISLSQQSIRSKEQHQSRNEDNLGNRQQTYMGLIENQGQFKNHPGGVQAKGPHTTQVSGSGLIKGQHNPQRVLHSNGTFTIQQTQEHRLRQQQQQVTQNMVQMNSFGQITQRARPLQTATPVDEAGQQRPQQLVGYGHPAAHVRPGMEPFTDDGHAQREMQLQQQKALNPFQNEMIKSQNAGKPSTHFESVHQLTALKRNKLADGDVGAWTDQQMPGMRPPLPDSSPKSGEMSVHGSMRLKTQKDFIISGHHANKKQQLSHFNQNLHTGGMKSELGWPAQGASGKKSNTAGKDSSRPGGLDYRQSLQTKTESKDDRIQAVNKQYLKSTYHKSTKIEGIGHENAQQEGNVLEPLRPQTILHKSIASPKRIKQRFQETPQNLSQQAYFIPGNENLGEFYPKNQSTFQAVQEQQYNFNIQDQSQQQNFGIPVIQRLKSSSHLGNISVLKNQKNPGSNLMSQSYAIKTDKAAKQATVMQGVSITAAHSVNPQTVGPHPSTTMPIHAHLGRQRVQDIDNHVEIKNKMNQELVVMGSGGPNSIGSGLVSAQRPQQLVPKGPLQGNNTTGFRERKQSSNNYDAHARAGKGVHSQDKRPDDPNFMVGNAYQGPYLSNQHVEHPPNYPAQQPIHPQSMSQKYIIRKNKALKNEPMQPSSQLQSRAGMAWQDSGEGEINDRAPQNPKQAKNSITSVANKQNIMKDLMKQICIDQAKKETAQKKPAAAPKAGRASKGLRGTDKQ